MSLITFCHFVFCGCYSGFIVFGVSITSLMMLYVYCSILCVPSSVNQLFVNLDVYCISAQFSDICTVSVMFNAIVVA